MCPSKRSLFSTGTLHAVELLAQDVPKLQRFFEENPEYFFAVEGRPPGPNEAHEEYLSELPAEWSFTKKWLLGFLNENNALMGMASLISDFLAPGVWNLGLFMIATTRHGSGDAQTLYLALEGWVLQNGAKWLRLGVVEGNSRAERFWQKAGFLQVRRREAVEMGDLVNTIHFMVKPLTGGKLVEYLALMGRDRPES